MPKWVKDKGYNPDLICQKIEATKTVSNGQVSFNGFEPLEHTVLLNIQDASEFMDLPIGVDDINIKINKLRYARKFISGT